MRHRTFIATSMLDALEQVRAALGDDAIILSSVEGENGGFEVTATVESRSQDTRDDELALEDILRDRLSPTSNERQHDPQIDAPHPQERHDDGPNIASANPLAHAPFDDDVLVEALRKHSLPSLLVDAILDDASDVEMEGLVDCLAYALEKRFRFDALPIAPRHPILLAGLPGAGKTVSIAKLAARATLEGVRAEMITLDAERTGAAAQASAYGQLLRMNVAHAGTIDEMRLVLDQRTERIEEEAGDHREACFIDTPAANPFDPHHFQVLKHQIDAGRHFAAAEPILVLSAAGDARSLAETAHAFSSLGVERMIVTQIDIARRLGGILAAAEVSNLAFAQISLTPYLARGLLAATPRRLASLLLSDPQGPFMNELD